MIEVDGDDAGKDERSANVALSRPVEREVVLHGDRQLRADAMGNGFGLVGVSWIVVAAQDRLRNVGGRPKPVQAADEVEQRAIGRGVLLGERGDLGSVSGAHVESISAFD